MQVSKIKLPHPLLTHNSLVIKTIYHAVNITFTKAKPFAIRCELNQAIQLTNIKYIIIIIDSMHTTKNIFDLSVHLYQIKLVAISKEITSILLIFGTILVKIIDCFIVLLTMR